MTRRADEPTGEVHVIEPGLLSTIQDASGRPGLGRFGIPAGGALDASSAALANLLVGNPADAAVLEMTAHGPRLRWGSDAHIAIVGADLGARVDGIRFAPGHSARVSAGATLAFEGRRGHSRAYLAVEGGFAVPSVLGSRSTDRRARFGGFEGRPLRAGDVLRFERGGVEPLRLVASAVADLGDRFDSADPADPPAPLLVVPTPTTFGWFTRDAFEALITTEWIVAPDSDRSGIRLLGSPVVARAAGIPSLAVPIGSIQVPPGGQPIVTMADGPVTGGYPVIGVVPRFEHGRLTQAVPGDVVRFARASVRDSRRAAAVARQREIGVEIEPGDFAAGWAR